MKVLRKPKLIPMNCKRCGCLYHPKLRNLQFDENGEIKDEVPCPYCRTANKARFEMPAESEGAE